jgi:hypothetical protein
LAWENEAREKHVFTLPAIESNLSPRIKKPNILRRLALARAEARFKTITGKNLLGMSENSVRQALTRHAGFALHGANQSQELVAITPYDRCRSFTITTIIQHSAENRHENTRHENHTTQRSSGLSAAASWVSFFFT